MKISIVPFDSLWKKSFEEEKELLADIFSNIPHAIEHIGSTAVEGLSAKPIIDLMIGLENFSLVNNYIEKICNAGYAYISKYEDTMPFRRFFSKGVNSEKTHHLHIVQFESEFWKRHLLFRDHLRKNPTDRNAYEQFKKKLAERDWETSNHYADAKTEFIRNMETRIEGK
jgi:GrpB-like predicted nucleotidyltransferase (UPF0157 family)